MSSRARRAADRFLVALDRLILGTFFRQIEIVGGENVPRTGPILVVANHGNSLVDPMLVFGYLPRPSRFLAKSTLWSHPAAKYLVRMAAAIPVYRRKDPGVDPAKNAETFARSHEVLAAGGAIAIFPEGLSHSEPALAPLKTGVARIALGAEERFGPLGIRIVPVGLNFEDPDAFRSRVLLRIGRAERIPTPPSRSPELEQAAVRDLTERVERALKRVTLNFDNWRQAELLDCAAQVYARRSMEAPRRARLADHFELKRDFLAGYRQIERHDPDLLRPVLAATERYDRLLRQAGLEDRQVAATYPRALVARFLLRHLWWLVLWPPLAAVGMLLNWLPFKIPGWVVRLARLKPDLRATYKVLISMMIFPFFWLLEASLVAWYRGWPWGLAALVAAPLTGYLALTYAEKWAALRDESRAFLKRQGRRATVAELVRRRAATALEIRRLVDLHEEMFDRPEPAASEG